MGKKRGIQLNISSAELGKLSKKELGKSIGGNPDATDEKWIKIWIEMYDKAYPGRIRKMMDDVSVEVALSGISKNAVVSEKSAMRKSFWLPADLQQVLEASYPSFWTNPQHAEWFCRKFPQFAFETYTKAKKR